MEGDLAAEPQVKHSILGIVSLAMSLLVATFYGIMITATGVIMVSSGQVGGSIDFDSMPAFFLTLALCIFASPLAALLSLVIGTASFLQRSANRLFPILGTSVSAVIFFTTCMVIVLAMLATR